MRQVAAHVEFGAVGPVGPVGPGADAYVSVYLHVLHSTPVADSNTHQTDATSAARRIQTHP